MYSKQSKKTKQCQKQFCIKLASKGFPSLYDYMSLKGIPVKHDKHTLEVIELNKIILWEELEKDFDEVAIAPDLTYCCVSSTSNFEAESEDSEGSLPGKLSNSWLCHTHCIYMESKESNGDYVHPCIGDQTVTARKIKWVHVRWENISPDHAMQKHLSRRSSLRRGWGLCRTTEEQQLRQFRNYKWWWNTFCKQVFWRYSTWSF